MLLFTQFFFIFGFQPQIFQGTSGIYDEAQITIWKGL